LKTLRAALQRIDGRSYRAYKDLKGSYAGSGWELWIDHVQGDPFAAPSRVRLILSAELAGFPGWSLSDRDRRSSAADFVNRALVGLLRQGSHRDGSGKSGELRALQPGQEVLERTSVVLFPDGDLELRFTAGLPAQGRRVLGRAAIALLCERIPELVEHVRASSFDLAALKCHLETVEDAQALRAQLEARELVAFVPEGACLPRRSGVDDRPLEQAQLWEVPPELRVTLETPNAGPRVGLGIPRGVTVITGGGFHGKSTLLRALERGVYDHVPGDGREAVVTVRDAVKVRAEDGRASAGVDISGFIGALPGGQDTQAFTTENASGSTSQAAAVVEALEVGSRCLLIDEDTSATNFMIRDARMQALVESEPITPLLDRIPELRRLGVSLVVVVGGCGDYLDVADTVLAMEAYRPRCVTARAKEVAAELPSRRQTSAAPWTTSPADVSRRISGRSIPAGRRRGEGPKIKVPTLQRCLYGREEVDLGAVEQLVEESQVRAIAQAWSWASERLLSSEPSLSEAVERIMRLVADEGLEALQFSPAGNLSEFRAHELAAFLNRLRTLRVRAD